MVPNWAPAPTSCHFLTLFMYFLVGVSQELQPLPGPELNPRYVPESSTLMFLQHELHRLSFSPASSFPPGHKGIRIVLGRFSSRPDIFANSLKILWATPQSLAQSSTTSPMSSAKALVIPWGIFCWIRLSKISTAAAKRIGEMGQPWRTPLYMPNPLYVLPL